MALKFAIRQSFTVPVSRLIMIALRSVRAIRRRLSLALCRAAGLTEIASTRQELDEIRAEHRRLKDAYSAHIRLAQTMARQTNSNTLMLKRWLEASPALQTVERAAQRKRSVILPPTADLRTIVPAD